MLRRWVVIATSILLSGFQINAGDDTTVPSALEKLQPIVAELCSKAGVKQPAQLETCEAVNAYVSSDITALIKRSYTLTIGQPMLNFWEKGLFTNAEMEALCAHEICHIKQHHLAKSILYNLPLRILFFPISPLISHFQIIPSSLLFTLGNYAISRPHEREADKKACALTEDPTSFISMLIKIHYLAENPSVKEEDFKQQCDEYQEALVNEIVTLTEEPFIARCTVLLQDHPSLRQRVEAILEFSAHEEES